MEIKNMHFTSRHTFIAIVFLLFANISNSFDVTEHYFLKDSTLNEAPQELRETCLEEYVSRNIYLKKFILYAPPTTVLSLSVGSYAYFMGLTGLLTLAPSELLFVTGFGLWYVATPVILGTAVTLEVRNSIEYFRNRSVVRLLDALRLNEPSNKHVRKFIKKFRKKHPESSITDDQIFSEILSLDKNGSLCNGELTGSNSDKVRKLLAKNKHLYKYLSSL